MSALRGASPRPPTLPRAPLLALALLLPMTATLALRAGSLADPGNAPLRLTAEQARRAGLWLDLRRPAGLPAALIALHDPPRPFPSAAPTILAASRDGLLVAVAVRRGQDPTTLVLSDAEGGQLRVPFGGLLAASFAPDATWLAATDGVGRLWQVETTDGAVSLLSDGPFTGRVVAESTGSVLALAVPSVEAPFRSRLVRIAPDGAVATLSDEELVYDVQPLEGDGLAIVAHRPSGTALLRLAAGAAAMIAELGPDAVSVSVSRDLGVLAWERSGDVFVRRADGASLRIGPGTNPRVSGDGAVVLVDVPDGTAAYDPDGEPLTRFDDPVLLLECEECRS